MIRRSHILDEELKKGTIENILAMDDAELGLRFLLGDLPRWVAIEGKDETQEIKNGSRRRVDFADERGSQNLTHHS